MDNKLIHKNTVHTVWARIYIAGDVDDAERVCKDFCYTDGMCVNVSETNYIYTAGEQSGVIVELINYPKYPTTLDEIFDTALELAEELTNELYQKSCTIMCNDKTYYFESEMHEDKKL